jgi:glycosyltransferase involved in cell wall biosynthesis
MTKKIEISAIVPVGERLEKTDSLAKEYLEALKETGKNFELVYVLDDRHAQLFEQLISLAKTEKRLKIVQLARSFGESAALTAGIEKTSGEVVLTLPAYYQIKAVEIQKLINGLDSSDVTIGVRWPRASASSFEQLRRRLFHWLVGSMIGNTFNDLGCGARALKRSVADEVPIYGDQHRFLPLLAIRRGFRVHEQKVAQSENDRYEGGYGPREYVRRLLDILTVFFLVRFTKKPLRFFGMIGSVTFALGTIFLAYVVVERLFFDISLADRPALLLSSLLVVLGLQIFALGLLGELIIFTHAREIKEYTIEKIIN